MSDHIKMPAVMPIVRYRGDGTQVRFVFPFPIFQAADLKVRIDGALQVSGFTVYGAGSSDGGRVQFDSPPAQGAIVVLERALPLQRVSDFIQGGGFSAQSLNNELDYLTASVQQVARENHAFLRYSDHEEPASVEMPVKSARAGKALGFDGDGNPIAVPLTAPSAGGAPYQSPKAGGVERSSHDKLSDLVSVKDFGAVGDGLADDTLALQQALAAHGNVYVPEGVYLISATIALESHQRLYGAGAASQLVCASDTMTALQICGSASSLSDIAIKGGLRAVTLCPADDPCENNTVHNIAITGAATGIVLDGGNDAGKQCRWNSLTDISIDKPLSYGVHLMVSGAGDRPRSNRFTAVSVVSHGVRTTGAGFYVQQGRDNNSFVDCTSDMNGESALACVRIGDLSENSTIVNLMCRSDGVISNVLLDAGSRGTSITNLTPHAPGFAVEDKSGGQYSLLNAAGLLGNRLGATTVSDLMASQLRMGSRYIGAAGVTALDLSASVILAGAWGGAMTLQLPKSAASNAGAVMVVKKTDATNSLVRVIEEAGGQGIDRGEIILGAQNDFVMLMSNGAEWYVISASAPETSSVYTETTGITAVDLGKRVYLLGAWGGDMTMQLPPASTQGAKGRQVTFKRTDSTSNSVSITVQGGNGPDRSMQQLTARFQTITVMSDGSEWYVISRA